MCQSGAKISGHYTVYCMLCCFLMAMILTVISASSQGPAEEDNNKIATETNLKETSSAEGLQSDTLPPDTLPPEAQPAKAKSKSQASLGGNLKDIKLSLEEVKHDIAKNKTNFIWLLIILAAVITITSVLAYLQYDKTKHLKDRLLALNEMSEKNNYITKNQIENLSNQQEKLAEQTNNLIEAIRKHNQELNDWSQYVQNRLDNQLETMEQQLKQKDKGPDNRELESLIANRIRNDEKELDQRILRKISENFSSFFEIYLKQQLTSFLEMLDQRMEVSNEMKVQSGEGGKPESIQQAIQTSELKTMIQNISGIRDRLVQDTPQQYVGDERAGENINKVLKGLNAFISKTSELVDELTGDVGSAKGREISFPSFYEVLRNKIDNSELQDLDIGKLITLALNEYFKKIAPIHSTGAELTDSDMSRLDNFTIQLLSVFEEFFRVRDTLKGENFTRITDSLLESRTRIHFQKWCQEFDLIYNEIKNYLKTLKIQPIEIELGQTMFNSSIHVGKHMRISEEYPESSIIGIMKYGYRRDSGEVIRKPEVIVCRRPASDLKGIT